MRRSTTKGPEPKRMGNGGHVERWQPRAEAGPGAGTRQQQGDRRLGATEQHHEQKEQTAACPRLVCSQPNQNKSPEERG